MLNDPAVRDHQLFYLDLAGSRDVTYNGPITVSGIDVPAFRARGPLRGSEAEVIAGRCEELLGPAHDEDHPPSEGPLDDVAFKPYTHVESAVDVVRDLMDDGKVTDLREVL